MTYLILGLVIFFGAHLFSAFRSREPGKDLKVKMGAGPYMGLYSLVSLAGFVLICIGYGATRGAGYVYGAPSWGRHVNYALMIPALILLVASQIPTGYIKKVAKHPMLLAVKLWALGHLLSNGELNSVILFGSFLAYAVIDRIMVKRRGDNGPGPDAAVKPLYDGIAVVGGLLAYVAIAHYLHPILFGVTVTGR
jgi:uncharacterized membrane protein